MYKDWYWCDKSVFLGDPMWRNKCWVDISLSDGLLLMSTMPFVDEVRLNAGNIDHSMCLKLAYLRLQLHTLGTNKLLNMNNPCAR